MEGARQRFAGASPRPERARLRVASFEGTSRVSMRSLDRLGPQADVSRAGVVDAHVKGRLRDVVGLEIRVFLVYRAQDVRV